MEQISTLLINKQITRQKSEIFERVKHRVELCGQINSGYMALCSCSYKFLEFRCGYVHFCPVCAKIKSRKLARTLKENLRYLNQQIKGFRDKRLRFLTLTIENVEDVEKGRRFLIKSLNTFLHRKKQENILGCIASIHTEKSKSFVGKFHIHFHTILYSSWLPVRQGITSLEWQQATKGRGKYVYVEDIKGLNQAIDYISNYLNKNSFSFENKFNLFFKKRFFFKYGCFNKSSPNYVLILQEKSVCAECGSDIQFLGSWTEEYQLIKGAYEKHPPPNYLKIVKKFFITCPKCDLNVVADDFSFSENSCKFCSEKENKQKSFQKRFSRYCDILDGKKITLDIEDKLNLLAFGKC